MSKLVDSLENCYNSGKFPHAILIESNNQSFCFSDILNVSKLLLCMSDHSKGEVCSECANIENGNCLNLFVIEPDGKNIKKEQILELKNKCSFMPVTSKNNVYIIKNAERLNKESANTMLKFIEEPFDNCIGFFITNNKDNVINTIKSRCSIYSSMYEDTNINDKLGLTDDEVSFYLEVLSRYLKEISNDCLIIHNRILIKDKIDNLEGARNFFGVMLYVYDNVIDKKLGKGCCDVTVNFDYLLNRDIMQLLREKQIIVNVIDKLMFNLNVELVYDKFVIEMSGLNE